MPILNPGPSSSAVANTRSALSAGTYLYANLPPASQYPAGTTVWTTDRGQFISNGTNWSATSSLSGSYTVSTLPSASSVTSGTQVYTTDGGTFISNGTNWTPISVGKTGGTRVGLIGDSLMARGYGNYTVATSVQVISATEVQISMTAHMMTVGNKVMISWTNQPLLSGYFTTVLRVIDRNNYTISNPGIIGSYPINVLDQTGAAVPSIFDLTYNIQTGFSSWIFATQSSGTYFNLFSFNALGGATSDQINTYCVTSALKMATYPDEWWYLPGANDAANGYTVAQTMANVNTTMNRLLATGKTVRLFTPAPYNGNATRSAFIQELRQQEIETYKNNPQVIIFDLTKWLIDPTSLTGNYKSGYDTDGVHPSPTGSYQAAKGFWSDMKLAGSSLLPTISPLFPVSQMDSYAYASGIGYSNLITNPMLIGTTGNKYGTALPTGTVATSFSVTNNPQSYGSCTSIVCTAETARADGNPGYWQQVVASTTGAGSFWLAVEQQSQNGVNANISTLGAGWYIMGCEVNISAVTNTIKFVNGNFDLYTTTGLPTQIWQALVNNGETWVTSLSGGNDTILLLAPPVYITALEPTGYWQPTFYVGMTGTGSATFKFGRPFMRRVNM
jgi:hypothetical protein